MVRGGEEVLHSARVQRTLDSSAPPLVLVMNASLCRNRWVEAAKDGNGVCLHLFMLDLLEEFSTVYSYGRKCHFIQLAAHKRMSSYFVDLQLTLKGVFDDLRKPKKLSLMCLCSSACFQSHFSVLLSPHARVCETLMCGICTQSCHRFLRPACSCLSFGVTHVP